MTDWRDDDDNFDSVSLFLAVFIVVGVMTLIYIAMGGGF